MFVLALLLISPKPPKYILQLVNEPRGCGTATQQNSTQQLKGMNSDTSATQMNLKSLTLSERSQSVDLIM